MEPTFLDSLLGEFRPYHNNACNFSRIVRWTLCTGNTYNSLGRLDDAKIHYGRLMNYLEAVKARKDIGERELAEQPPELFLRANVGSEVDGIIREYLGQ
jgi:hypothetical protein